MNNSSTRYDEIDVHTAVRTNHHSYYSETDEHVIKS